MTSAEHQGGDEDEPLHTSIVLNRLLQWHALVDQCSSRQEHLAFLVHGTKEQDLHLFMERIRLYLSEECRLIHRVRKVQRTSDRTPARSAEEWQRCLIRATQARSGELDFILASEAASAPVLFLFADADGPLRQFDEKAAGGLVRLLASRVSPALESLTANKKLRNPVRFVIPIEHPPIDRAEDPAVKALASGLAGLSGLRLERVLELGFPEWPDVLIHIERWHLSADESTRAQCEAIHREIAASPGRSIMRLGNALHDVLVASDEKGWYERKY